MDYSRAVSENNCVTLYPIRRDAFVGVDVCMNLDSAFLLPRLGMTSYTFEQHIGEQCHSRGVYNLQPVYPARRGSLPAVRGKLVTIFGVQTSIRLLKD